MFKIIVQNSKGFWDKQFSNKSKAKDFFKTVKKSGNIATLQEIKNNKVYQIDKFRG